MSACLGSMNQEPRDDEAAAPGPKRWITRRRALGVMVGAAGACVADAFVTGPRWLSVTRKEISCPSLYGSHNGLRLGVISDIHWQPGHVESLLERAVDCLLEEKPDLILMAGDFVDDMSADIPSMLRVLSRLEAPHGVYGCMGNHDGWTRSWDALGQGFNQLGFSFLVNAHTRLQIKGESLAVAATDFVWHGYPDPGRALAGLPSKVPVIGMVHEPDFFDEMVHHRPIALQISGHSHGGQCRVPLIGYAPALPKYARKYVEGAYSKENSRLFVSRGIGTTTLPVRFACRPEVAILTLRA